MAVFCLNATAADARSHHRHPRAQQVHHSARVEDGGTITTSGRYASFVVDAKTGKVLYAKNADAPRHPASLTKMMTLYILFEEMERGRFTPSSPLKISAHAAAQQPTKLGLRPGDTIEVGDAIRGLVTQSANDAAVTIAENIAGSEDAFARRMTATAHRIGMNGTTFRNASGLPNDEQVTTAHDIVTLGRALQERFPEQFKIFSTRSFAYHGRVYGNHNHLLGRIEGVDGIKTGYTEASGFNLVTDLKRDGHHIVAAVMGGPTGYARDAHMIKLLDATIASSSTGPRIASVFTDPKMAARDGDEKPTKPIRIDRGQDGTPDRPVAAKVEPSLASNEMVQPQPVLASAIEEPIARPKPRMAVAEAHSPTSDATTPPRADDRGAAVAMAKAILNADQNRKPVVAANSDTIPPMPSSKPKLSNADPSPLSERSVAPSRKAEAEKDQPDRIVTASLEPAAKTSDPVRQRPPAPIATRGDSWAIQIGAVDDVGAAKTLLSRAKSVAEKPLSGIDPVTETVTKGSTTLYRARFAGFTGKSQAESACAALKRKEFACFVMRQ
ncbi:MAG: SPOR domain-containing protein [Ancalomicrobiaceae bacterium]|nr:SPOR domain-containing protein [Ancalomicrobiaceae bacterium]